MYKSRTTPNKNKLVGFAWAGWIFDFFDLILYSFLLIGIQKEFGLSNAEVGIVYSASLAITAVGGVFLGFVGDKYGRRPAIIISVFIFSVGTLISGFAWSLGSLLVFRLITGFGIGGEWAAGHTLINESLPSGERGKASSLIQSGAPIGAGIASLVGGFITPIIGWRMSFILGAVPSFILVLFMLKYLPESPQYLIFKEESRDIRDSGEEIPQGSGYIRTATKRTFADLFSVKKNLFLGMMLSLWGMLGYWVVFSWSPKYLSEINYSDHQIGYWMFLANVGAFIGYLSFGHVAEYLGKFRLSFSLYATTFALGIVIFSLGTINELLLIGLAGIFITGLGTGFFSGYGPLYCRLFPAKIRNTSASFCFNMGRLGAFVAPILVVQIAISVGLGWALTTGSIFAIIAALWVYLIPEETCNRTDLEFDVDDLQQKVKVAPIIKAS